MNKERRVFDTTFKLEVFKLIKEQGVRVTSNEALILKVFPKPLGVFLIRPYKIELPLNRKKRTYNLTIWNPNLYRLIRMLCCCFN